MSSPLWTYSLNAGLRMVLLEINAQRVDQRRLLWIGGFLRVGLGPEGQQGPEELDVWYDISRILAR